MVFGLNIIYLIEIKLIWLKKNVSKDESWNERQFFFFLREYFTFVTENILFCLLFFYINFFILIFENMFVYLKIKKSRKMK